MCWSGAGIGSFHPLKRSPLIEQVESEIPIAFGDTLLGLVYSSFSLCFLWNNLKILGAMIGLSCYAGELCVCTGCMGVGGWDECVAEVVTELCNYEEPQLTVVPRAALVRSHATLNTLTFLV